MFFGFGPNGFINLSPPKKCFNSVAALFFKNILHQIMFYGNCTRWFFSQAVFILFFGETGLLFLRWSAETMACWSWCDFFWWFLIFYDFEEGLCYVETCAMLNFVLFGLPFWIQSCVDM